MNNKSLMDFTPGKALKDPQKMGTTKNTKLLNSWPTPVKNHKIVSSWPDPGLVEVVFEI